MATENFSKQPHHKNNFLLNDCDSLPDETNLEIEDRDTYTLGELEKLFKHKYKIHDELAVTNDNSYVLSLAKDDSFSYIAAGLSDGSVCLFETKSEKGLYIETPPPNKKLVNTCGVRFVDETPNLLLVGTTNGIVRLLDLRTRNEVLRCSYSADSPLKYREILSFDRNSNGQLLAVGSAQRDENVNIVIYDLRTSKELFRYTESHQDDVTALSFHPQNPHLFCSGATDGLINIFNVELKDEDYAIITTINTESTVHKVNWHKNKRDIYTISCITHTNAFKAYELDGDIIADFDKLKITETIKRENKTKCNLINCHSMADGNLILVTGCIADKSVLRSCIFNYSQLLPYANFEGNKQIVRESIFDSKTNILATAGERGLVTLWTPMSWYEEPKNTNMSAPITSYI